MAAICNKCGSDKVLHLHKNHKFSYSCPNCITERIRKVVFITVGLIISCLLVPIASQYADKVRGYDGTGGEFLIPFLLPLVVILIYTFKNLKR